MSFVDAHKNCLLHFQFQHGNFLFISNISVTMPFFLVTIVAPVCFFSMAMRGAGGRFAPAGRGRDGGRGRGPAGPGRGGGGGAPAGPAIGPHNMAALDAFANRYNFNAAAPPVAVPPLHGFQGISDNDTTHDPSLTHEECAQRVVDAWIEIKNLEVNWEIADNRILCGRFGARPWRTLRSYKVAFLAQAIYKATVGFDATPNSRLTCLRAFSTHRNNRYRVLFNQHMFPILHYIMRFHNDSTDDEWQLTIEEVLNQDIYSFPETLRTRLVENGWWSNAGVSGLAQTEYTRNTLKGVQYEMVVAMDQFIPCCIASVNRDLSITTANQCSPAVINAYKARAYHHQG